MTPKVTYIVRTTGRRNAWLAEALASIRAQTRPSRVVLVLDGPEEHRGRVRDEVAVTARSACGRLIGRESQDAIELAIIDSRACSQAGAWNAGLPHVETPFVVALDDDDVVYPHHAEALASALEANQGAGVAYARVLLMDADPVTNRPLSPRHEYGRPFTLEELRQANRIPVHGAMERIEVSRSDLHKPEDGPIHDWGHWLRLASAGVRFVSVDTRVGEYRVRGDGANGFTGAEMVRYSELVRARWA